MLNSRNDTGQQSALLTLENLEPFITQHGDMVAGRFGDIRLTSAFQPIYSLAHRRPVGYEALLRPVAPDGAPLSPLAVFGKAQGEAEHVFLDRMCRVVHTRNFLAQSDPASWLFLNVDPLVTVNGKNHGAFFNDVLERHGIAPHRIVIEILEGKIQDEGLLAESVMFFKELGCLVAIDDFGAGHSNFERIWRIQPHIVKLDRNMIAQSVHNRAVRRVLPNLVKLIHEAGSLVLIEGVETEDEGLVTLDTDVDFAQGYYFARPAATLPSPEQGQQTIERLCRKFQEATRLESSAYRNKLHDYRDAFEVFLKQFLAGTDAGEACHAFLELPDAERCYLLDREGRQLGANFMAASASGVCDLRFRPLADSNNATWARRHYFRRAIASPGQVQISRPYLSIAGGNLCVTLSVAVFHEGELKVLCGDMMWEEHP